MSRLAVVLAVCLSSQAFAGKVTVPADVGVGPEAFWFYGPLLENRGGVPHFALAFNLHAIIDRDWITDNRDRIPAQYRSQADRVTELRVGPSLFIPSTVYVSPPIDALNGVGLFGLTWKPLGLTLVSTGQKSERAWNKSRGRFLIEGNLLLTALYLYSNLRGQPLDAIPSTFFLRPGLELQTTLLVNVTRTVLVSFGGGAQVYVPQRLGAFLDVLPIERAVWLSFFAFLKFHVRFPYEVDL
ncbi:MAG: hypothetical protein INH41_17305 [Myxococcaceae bacterium]|nr:hypothetical protein [Myxococcaceae bacterium]